MSEIRVTQEISEDLEARKAFEAAYKHLDLEPKSRDSWGRPVYAYPHVELIWNGWRDSWKHRNRQEENDHADEDARRIAAP